jgi:hypothetical protein
MRGALLSILDGCWGRSVAGGLSSIARLFLPFELGEPVYIDIGLGGRCMAVGELCCYLQRLEKAILR